MIYSHVTNRKGRYDPDVVVLSVLARPSQVIALVFMGSTDASRFQESPRLDVSSLKVFEIGANPAVME